jgi:hypothetical protein
LKKSGRKTADFWQKEGRLFRSGRVMIVSWIFYLKQGVTPIGVALLFYEDAMVVEINAIFYCEKCLEIKSVDQTLEFKKER